MHQSWAPVVVTALVGIESGAPTPQLVTSTVLSIFTLIVYIVQIYYFHSS